jgi:hypothetical protein
MNELVCENTTAALYVGTPATQSKEASLMDDRTHHSLRIENSSFAPLADQRRSKRPIPATVRRDADIARDMRRP